MSEYYIKKPCQHCPFRSDVRPFLTNARAEELADLPQNPYSTFPCHKTTVSDDESEDGEMMCTEQTKECAGFLTMRANELGEDCMPEGFTPSYDDVYSDSWEMVGAYEEQNELDRERREA